MKKFILITICLIFATSSCMHTKKEGKTTPSEQEYEEPLVENTEIKFDSIIVNKDVKLYPDKPGQVSFEIHFVYPTTFGTIEELQKLQSLFYENFIGKEFADANSPQEAVDRYIKYYSQCCRNDGECYNDTDFYLFSIHNRILFKNENIISIEQEKSSCSGGNTSQDSYVTLSLDLKHIKRLTIDDLFKEDSESRLKKAIYKRAKPYMERDGVLPDDIIITDNYLFTDENFVLTYNPYDVNFITFDPALVEIPYKEIAHLLKRDAFIRFFPKSKGVFKK